MENTLEHQGFYGIVDYSSEDEVFHGKIVGINDLVTFEGDSVASLKNSFIEAVEDYVALCQEVGVGVLVHPKKATLLKLSAAGSSSSSG